MIAHAQQQGAMTARRLSNYSRSQPSISATIRLPHYEKSCDMAWPVERLNALAATLAAAMTPQDDPRRYGPDWWQVAEQDDAERRKLGERRDAEEQQRVIASRTEYERTLNKQQEERERRAQEARRGA
jgi:hypothetical protein